MSNIAAIRSPSAAPASPANLVPQVVTPDANQQGLVATAELAAALKKGTGQKQQALPVKKAGRSFEETLSPQVVSALMTMQRADTPLDGGAVGLETALSEYKAA